MLLIKTYPTKLPPFSRVCQAMLCDANRRKKAPQRNICGAFEGLRHLVKPYVGGERGT